MNILMELYEKIRAGQLDLDAAVARLDEAVQAGKISAKEISHFNHQIDRWILSGEDSETLYVAALLNYLALEGLAPRKLRGHCANHLVFLLDRNEATLRLIIAAMEDTLWGIGDDNRDFGAVLREDLGSMLLAVAHQHGVKGGERDDELERAIRAFGGALQVYTPTNDPEPWAATQHNLGIAYTMRIRDERADNLERAIDAYDAALTVYTRKSHPEKWAQAQYNLGATYRERIRGERADNFERAIDACDAALKVFTRKSHPEKWARTQSNLGATYGERIRGERADNLERAIDACDAALTVYTRASHPEEWATVQNNRGNIYGDRIRGERADNLERAIDACDAALEVFTRKSYPKKWAGTQSNLGVAYGDRIRGERADNLERAIEAYNAALTVYTRESHPEDWAKTQQNLGTAYRARVRSERADNLERAIEAYDAALTVYTREGYLEEWARIQSNLGSAYFNLIRGERADNLERAIEAYDAALTFYTREGYLEEWARIKSNLGNIYRERIRGERANNLERAIDACAAALTIYTRESHSEDWAGTQNNFGNAYSQRIRGERADNLERAIVAYDAALTIHTRESHPEEWAKTQTNRSNVYRERIRGERADNLELAKEACLDALAVLTREGHPEMWATTQSNLGAVYCNRIRGEHADNLERAIEACDAALAVRTREGHPEKWATTQTILGIAYRQRIRGERADNIERAIEAYDAALTVHTRESHPEDWAKTQQNRANAYRERIRGERADNLELALKAYKATAGLWTAKDNPEMVRTVRSNQSATLLEAGRWEEALQASEEGLTASRYLLELTQLDPEAREHHIGASERLYANCAFALARLGRAEEAFEVLEEGRARELRYRAGRDRADLEGVPKAIHKRFLEAVQRVRDLEAEWVRPEAYRPPNLADETRRAHCRLEEATQEIRALKPNFMDVNVGLNDVAAICPGEQIAVVELAVTDAGTLALILHADTDHVKSIIMENITRKRVIEEWLFRYDESSNQIIGGWLWRFVYPHASTYENQNLLRRIGKELAAPLASRLKGAKRMLLVAHEGLHLLPLEAAPFATENGTISTLGDMMAISVSPSAFYLAENPLRMNEVEPIIQVLTLENPCGDPQLQYTALEVARIADSAGTENTLQLPGNEATIPALAQRASGCSIVHFSCHGHYNWESPLLSGLELYPAEDEPSVDGGRPGHLTLLHLYQGKVDLKGVRLITMSACQTGVTEFRERAEEAVGLPGGLLVAGVPTVVGTLWSVTDVSAAFLMSRFYWHVLRERLPPDLAMQMAKKETREVTWKVVIAELGEARFFQAYDKLLAFSREQGQGAAAEGMEQIKQGGEKALNRKPFQHPHHWASFQVWGNGWTPLTGATQGEVTQGVDGGRP